MSEMNSSHKKQKVIRVIPSPKKALIVFVLYSVCYIIFCFAFSIEISWSIYIVAGAILYFSWIFENLRLKIIEASRTSKNLSDYIKNLRK